MEKLSLRDHQVRANNSLEIMATCITDWHDDQRRVKEITELIDTLVSRLETAEQQLLEIEAALKSHCDDDFVVITDGTIDWRATIAEFVSFIRTEEK